MDVSTLVAFAAAYFVFAASPGPDNVTIVARTIAHGSACGIAYGIGTTVGVLVFLALATVAVLGASSRRIAPAGRRSADGVCQSDPRSS